MIVKVDNDRCHIERLDVKPSQKITFGEGGGPSKYDGDEMIDKVTVLKNL